LDKIRFLFSGFFGLVLFLGLGFALLTGLNLPVSARDDEGELKASPFDNLAVVLVIDVSGSMSYTDPLRLRETAAGMFIDLLGADDYLSVITFDHEAMLIKPLSPVGTRADKEALMDELSPQLDYRGDTDFIEALDLARSQFDETDTGEKIPVIFMLTDGEPDPYPGALANEEFMEGYMKELWEQIDELAAEELMIYSVAFSDEIDPDVMDRIASETGGKTYILEDPGDLLVTFYEALGILKDRRGFLDQIIDLEDGGRHTFNFTVSEAVRQINLVLVSSADAEDAQMSVNVEAPGGEAADDLDQLLIGGRDNYLLTILSRPEEEHFGEWAVEVEGSGEIRAMGNADLYLEALLMEPDPEAHYPVEEPLDIRVEVITREKYEDEDFQLEMKITGPEDTVPDLVTMDRKGDYFRGVYEQVDLTGEYELNWTLKLDGNTIVSDSARITVRDLPGINTDFWSGEEGFRRGEETIVSATLEWKGMRLQEGSNLQLDSFDFDLEYGDGARYEAELFDSGEDEHGNSRAGDGIWSNRFVFERKGEGEALVTVSGEYQGSEFVLRRSFDFKVAEPGEVSVAMLPGEYIWARSGGSFAVPLELVSDSEFTQVLRFSSGDEQVELLEDRAGLSPGESRTFWLKAEVGEDVEPGSFASVVDIRLEDTMTLLQPETVEYEVDVLTLMEALQVRYSGFFSGAMIAVFAGVFLAVGLFGGGSLLNRFYLQPRLQMKGNLHYRKEQNNPHPGSGSKRKFNLEENRKQEVVIAFGSDNPQADYVIPECEYAHDMVLSNRWNDHLPKFLRGWKALFSRKLMVETVLKCTPPGVLVAGGKVLTRKELQHEDKFESGGFIFDYHRSPEKGVELNNSGKDILDGKL